MQLKRHRKIKSAVTALTAALVGTSVANATGTNHTETSLLIYSEKNRAKVTEGNFSLTKLLKHDYTLDLRLTYDGMTGATPTGGTPSKNPQTVTRSSGGKTVTIGAGEFPVDHAFRDVRFAGAASLSHSLGRMTSGTLGGQVSSEHDYTSVGVNGEVLQNFNQNNTTVGLALSLSHDVVKPVGGLSEPFSRLTNPGTRNDDRQRPNFDGRIKNVSDLVVSLSQVLDRKTVMRLSYSFDYARGFLSDPYKLISLVRPPDSANAGEPAQSLFEKRPDTRIKNSLYAELRRFVFGNSLDLSYRYFWDDWGVKSHSVDLGYLFDFKRKGSFQPHLRWYRQSRANFSRPFLILGAPLPDYASADSRLARFDAYTAGISYSIPTHGGSLVTIAAEYYTQIGDRSPPEAFGNLTTIDLFPKLDAIMLRIGYGHDF